jgi:predicted permease
MNLFLRIFSRKRIYAELSESMREHLDERVDELIRDGMSREDAERVARREFGNPMLLEQRSREVWQWPAMESWLADARFALRRLRKSPGFAITVLLTLAIGIGANTAVFSVLNSVLFRPLPYPNADELVALRLYAPGAEGLADFRDGLRLSASMDLTFSAHNRTFDAMGVWQRGSANVTGLAQPEEVGATYISDGVLQTLNVPPVAGRWIQSADQLPRSRKTVMLSYGYWQRRFGGDPNVVGRTVRIDSEAREIVGVMPQGFEVVNQKFDILIPLAFDPRNQILAGFGYNGIARLKPGSTISQANADISRLIGVWMDSWTNGPGTNPHFYETWKITPAFRPLKQEVIGSVASVLWVVMGTIGMVMLIACTNVANLLLVRAETRRQELEVRAALGAGRGRIARELLLESVLLGLIGGIAGIGVASAGLRLLVAIGPATLPRLSEISLDWQSLVFTLLLSVLSGFLFGSIPALKYAGRGIALSLRSGGRSASSTRERQRSRDILVVAQVAMALVLLVSAMLMIRTFAALRNVDPGFADADHIETVRISVPSQLITDPQIAARMENSIADNLAAIPGVKSAAFSNNVPMDGIEPDWDTISGEGKSYVGGEPPLRLFDFVSPGYFHAAGTRFLAGRDYTWSDIYGFRPVGIVSESMARESWGSAAAAIGNRFHVTKGQPWVEVIGVVQDVSMNGVDQKPPAIVYWPFMVKSPYNGPDIDTQRGLTFVLHTDRAGSQDLLAEMQRAVWSVNGNLPLASVQTLGEIYSHSLARTSFTLVMLAMAGAMALALGIIGLYGLISYTVSQRTREIGIRMALGAQKSALRWMFLRSGMVLTTIGVVIGLTAAAGIMRLMKSILFGISPMDPLTYAAVPLVLVAAAALASYLPARRAAAIDPVEALRAE